MLSKAFEPLEGKSKKENKNIFAEKLTVSHFSGTIRSKQQYCNIWANEGKSVASFCHHVAALVPDMFGNFYLVNNHKICTNSATNEAREKISTYLESV